MPTGKCSSRLQPLMWNQDRELLRESTRDRRQFLHDITETVSSASNRTGFRAQGQTAALGELRVLLRVCPYPEVEASPKQQKMPLLSRISLRCVGRVESHSCSESLGQGAGKLLFPPISRGRPSRRWGWALNTS